MSESEDNSETNVETETFRRLERLRDLRIEHRDLDDSIQALGDSIQCDQMQLARLKRRRAHPPCGCLPASFPPPWSGWRCP